MKKRSEQEWQDLFAQQTASGLSAAQFCKEQGLCNKHFSVRKKQLGVAGEEPVVSFVRAVKASTNKPGNSIKPGIGLSASLWPVLVAVRDYAIPRVAGELARKAGMIHWDPVPIYVHRAPVDFRKPINGLSLLVQESMELDVFSEALFVFGSRSRDKIKILYGDKTGFCRSPEFYVGVA